MKYNKEHFTAIAMAVISAAEKMAAEKKIGNLPEYFRKYTKENVRMAALTAMLENFPELSGGSSPLKEFKAKEGEEVINLLTLFIVRDPERRFGVTLKELVQRGVSDTSLRKLMEGDNPLLEWSKSGKSLRLSNYFGKDSVFTKEQLQELELFFASDLPRLSPVKGKQLVFRVNSRKSKFKFEDIPWDVLRIRGSSPYYIQGETLEMVQNDGALLESPKIDKEDLSEAILASEYEEDFLLEKGTEEFSSDTRIERQCWALIKKIQQRAFYGSLLKKNWAYRPIYFRSFLDSRGRIYSRGYLFNPQGTSIDKGLLGVTPETLSPEGEKWAFRALANSFNPKVEGINLDKLPWETREEWARKMFEFIPYLSPLQAKDKIRELSHGAESPAEFISQGLALYRALKFKAPYGAVCPLDATASGAQLMGRMCGEAELLRLSNIVSSQREDLYKSVIDLTAKEGHPLDRKTTKFLVIPMLYGSTGTESKYLSSAQEISAFRKWKAQFKSWQQLAKILTGDPANPRVISIWNPKWTEYGWYMPDGMRTRIFPCGKGENATRKETVSFLGKEIEVEVPNVGPQPYSAELAANITHALDGYVCREIIRRMSWNPGWAKDLREHPEGWFSNENPDKLKAYQEAMQSGSQAEWTGEMRFVHQSRQVMRKLLLCGRKYRMYSVRILTEANKYNIDMIPQNLWDLLWTRLASKGHNCTVVTIHDSFGVHPNHAEELRRIYRDLMEEVLDGWYLPQVISQLTSVSAEEMADPNATPWYEKKEKVVLPRWLNNIEKRVAEHREEWREAIHKAEYMLS